MTTLSDQTERVPAPGYPRPAFPDKVPVGAKISRHIDPEIRLTVLDVRRYDDGSTTVIGFDTDGQPSRLDFQSGQIAIVHDGPAIPGPIAESHPGGPAERTVLINGIADLRKLAEVPGNLIHDEITALADRYADQVSNA